MKKQKLYKCVEDFQNTGWCIGEVGTVNEWRQKAIEWADSDELYGVLKELKKMAQSKVLDFISDFWEIRFEECEG